MNFSKAEIEALMEGIYSGEITETELPQNLYFAIADYLKSNLYKGFGIKFDKLRDNIAEGIKGAFDAKDLELLTELRENIYIFSGSKLFQQTLEYREALFKDDGDLKSMDEFKEDFQAIYGQYNETWLETEYNTTYGQAQNAVRWGQVEKQKDILPYLTYSAIMDDRTSEICAPLDGISLPVDDTFWDTFMPENHYNCRCTVEQHDNENILTAQAEVEEKSGIVGKDMDDSFKFNVGKTGEVFPKDHPYFEVPKEYKDLAKENFNLPIPATDAEQGKGFNFIPASTIEMAKDNILKIFSENIGMEVSSVEFATELSLEEINFRSKYLYDLSNEYNTSFSSSSMPLIKFASTEKTLGSVRYWNNGVTDLVNFGDRIDINRAKPDRVWGLLDTAFKCKVDKVNLNLSTLTHEFGHFISVDKIKSDYDGFGGFWREIKKIKREYNKEVKLLSANRNITGLNKMYLGDYANTNIREFMAEGFTEYKLNSNPSPYAEKIGKTIDKYFKK